MVDFFSLDGVWYASVSVFMKGRNKVCKYKPPNEYNLNV